MNKVSMVTLWVDPKTYQILQYTFDDMDWTSSPAARWCASTTSRRRCRWARRSRTSGCRTASRCSSSMMLAVGAVDATYRVDYLNYKEAAVTYKIK